MCEEGISGLATDFVPSMAFDGVEVGLEKLKAVEFGMGSESSLVLSDDSGLGDERGGFDD